jgi:hypothetical protein
VHNKPTEKKNRARTRAHFKNCSAIILKLKKGVLQHKKIFMTSPPPPVDELFEGLSGKIF